MNILQRSLHRTDAVQQRFAVAAFLVGVYKKYGDDNAGALCVQLTYSMFVTLFPLLLLLVTILSIVLAGQPAWRARVLDTAFGDFPIIGTQLRGNIHAMQRSSVFGLAVGIAGLIYGATGLAQAGLFAMSKIWNIPRAIRPNYIGRMARAIVFLAVLGLSLIVTTALAGFGTFGRHNFLLGIASEAVAAIVNIGACIAVFRTLTPRQVPIRSLLVGAIVGGVAWTVLQAVGSYVVGHDLKGASALYGMFGLVLGLLAWIYLAMEVTLYAAEVNTVRAHRLWPRALIQPPLTEADQRSLAMQVTEHQSRPEQDVETRFHARPMTEDEFVARGYEQAEPAAGVEQKVPDRALDAPGRDEGRDEQ